MSGQKHSLIDFDRDHEMVELCTLQLPDDFTGGLNELLTLSAEGLEDAQEVTIFLTQLAQEGIHPVWYCRRKGSHDQHELRADLTTFTGTLWVKQRTRFGGPFDDIAEAHIHY